MVPDSVELRLLDMQRNLNELQVDFNKVEGVIRDIQTQKVASGAVLGENTYIVSGMRDLALRFENLKVEVTQKLDMQAPTVDLVSLQKIVNDNDNVLQRHIE